MRSPIHSLRNIPIYFDGTTKLRSIKDWGNFKSLKELFDTRKRTNIGPELFFLFELYDKNREQRSLYINDEDLKKRLRRQHDKHSFLTSDKEQFFLHCSRNSIATIPILAVITKDGSRQPGSESIHALRDLVGSEDSLFIKTNSGSGGRGSFSIHRNTETPESNWTTKELDATERCCMEAPPFSWIAQPTVKPSIGLQTLTGSTSLSTARVITVMRQGHQPELLCAMVRLISKGNTTDNFSRGRSGNLVSGIDIKNGTLKSARGASFTGSFGLPLMYETDTHPATNVEITGFQVDHWDELVLLVTKAHQSLPMFNALGWDVAITDHGPIIVECNCTFDVSGMQVALGQGLRTHLEAALAGDENIPA